MEFLLLPWSYRSTNGWRDFPSMVKVVCLGQNTLLALVAESHLCQAPKSRRLVTDLVVRFYWLTACGVFERTG